MQLFSVLVSGIRNILLKYLLCSFAQLNVFLGLIVMNYHAIQQFTEFRSDKIQRIQSSQIQYIQSSKNTKLTLITLCFFQHKNNITYYI